jgi:methionine biosynthesis protein MetW
MITRADFEAIAAWIPEGARVLDLGCGDGSLLAYLKETKKVEGYGIENDGASIVRCIQTGVNVIQMNIESGMKEIADQSFDIVILSQTLQAMKRTERVVADMLRVGREVIGGIACKSRSVAGCRYRTIYLTNGLTRRMCICAPSRILRRFALIANIVYWDEWCLTMIANKRICRTCWGLWRFIA